LPTSLSSQIRNPRKRSPPQPQARTPPQSASAILRSYPPDVSEDIKVFARLGGPDLRGVCLSTSVIVHRTLTAAHWHPPTKYGAIIPSVFCTLGRMLAKSNQYNDATLAFRYQFRLSPLRLRAVAVICDDSMTKVDISMETYVCKACKHTESLR
jgi:hypothetical protein